jgi:hypothetical protein
MSTASKHENIIFRKSSENLQVSILDIEYNARIMDVTDIFPSTLLPEAARRDRGASIRCRDHAGESDDEGELWSTVVADVGYRAAPDERWAVHE